jgi:hypothetical protein
MQGDQRAIVATRAIEIVAPGQTEREREVGRISSATSCGTNAWNLVFLTRMRSLYSIGGPERARQSKRGCGNRLVTAQLRCAPVRLLY